MTTAALADEQQRLQQLESELKQALQRSGTPSAEAAATPQDLAPLTGRVDTLAKVLAALDQKVNALAAKFAADMHGLQTEKSAAAQIAMTHAEADARAILAGNLLRKVEAGVPFADGSVGARHSRRR